MPHKFVTPQSLATIEKILALVAKKALTRDQLQVELRMSKPGMRSYLAHLQSAPRRVRIARWVRTDGNIAPAYRVGTGKDAPRPPAPSKKERDAQRWQSLKADPEKHKAQMGQRHIAAVLRRVRSNPQSWLSALVPGPVGAVPKELSKRRAE